MNTETLTNALQYIDDDLLIEFFEMDDKLTIERKTVRMRYLKIIAAAACFLLLVTLAGAAFHIRMKDVKKETFATETDIGAEAVSVLLYGEKYQMFEDSPLVRELMAEYGLSVDDVDETKENKPVYLEMFVADGRPCFTSAEEKTDYILYTYVNANGNNAYMLQFEDTIYLLIKGSVD